MTLDPTTFLTRAEGTHFDRKSLFEGPPNAKAPRDRKTVRDQIATYAAAFANAEGGVLILGVEDDGTPTGHRYPQQVVDQMLNVPRDRLVPSLPPGEVVSYAGVELLVFEIPMASEPVQVTGDGFPLRIGDTTIQANPEQIQALKFRGLAESFEARPSLARLEDLDPVLLSRAQAGAGLDALTPTEYLVRRRMADWRGSTLVLRQAAELVFCAAQPEHPAAGIRVFRVLGTERRTGMEYNVEERPRIEGALPRVLDEAFRVIDGLLRRPARLGLDARFHPTPEYPEFSWQEALLNAVAHRDYGLVGASVEVWLYDDRLEVMSPGGLLPTVSLDRLLALERTHMSRNPRIVRALVDLGRMREAGEGIPRMFAEMEAAFLPRPELSDGTTSVRLALRNTVTLTTADRALLAAVAGEDLGGHELRALLHADRHGQIDNSSLRASTGLDTLAASQVLRRLRDRGLLEFHAAGAASYYTRPSPRTDGGAESTDLGSPNAQNVPESTDLRLQSTDLRPDVAGAAAALPADLERAVESARSRRVGERKSGDLIVRLCEHAPHSVAELASLLGRNERALRRTLRDLVAAGRLTLLHPDRPNHPAQAYIATQAPLLSDAPEDVGE